MVSKVPVKYIRPAASFMTAACSTIQSPSVIHPKQPPLESCRYRCRNPVLSVAQLNPPCSSSKSTFLCPVLTSNIPHSDKTFPGYGDLTCTSRSPTKRSSPEKHSKNLPVMEGLDALLDKSNGSYAKGKPKAIGTAKLQSTS